MMDDGEEYSCLYRTFRRVSALEVLRTDIPRERWGNGGQKNVS